MKFGVIWDNTFNLPGIRSVSEFRSRINAYIRSVDGRWTETAIFCRHIDEKAGSEYFHISHLEAETLRLAKYVDA